MFVFLFILTIAGIAGVVVSLSAAPVVWRRTRERYDAAPLAHGRCGRDIAEGLLRRRKVALPVIERDPAAEPARSPAAPDSLLALASARSSATAPDSSPATALRLPSEVFHGRSVFAAGLAACEVERALQRDSETPALRLRRVVERYRAREGMPESLEFLLAAFSQTSNLWSRWQAAAQAADLARRADFVEPEERAGISRVAWAAAMNHANDLFRFLSKTILALAVFNVVIYGAPIVIFVFCSIWMLLWHSRGSWFSTLVNYLDPFLRAIF